MKDREAREKADYSQRMITDLFKYLGLQYWDMLREVSPIIPLSKFASLERTVLQMVDRIAALEEAAKPTCKTCGQKIQEGLHSGQVETLAAGLESAKRTKR